MKLFIFLLYRQPSHFSFVKLLHKLSSAKLSRRFYIRPQSMGQVLGGLEERRLIKQEQDPSSLRILLTSFTDDGRNLGKRSDNEISQIEKDTFRSFRYEDIAHLRATLRDISNAVRDSASISNCVPESLGHHILKASNRGDVHRTRQQGQDKI
jgi:DNA-binding MarR family transcriptional regulator